MLDTVGFFFFSVSGLEIYAWMLFLEKYQRERPLWNTKFHPGNPQWRISPLLKPLWQELLRGRGGVVVMGRALPPTPPRAVYPFLTDWATREAQEYSNGLQCPPPGDLPNPGIKPRSPTLQTDSLPSEPPGKPKNTRVGSLYLLQGIFSTQELNCRRIYQLSYKPRERLKSRDITLPTKVHIVKGMVFPVAM